MGWGLVAVGVLVFVTHLAQHAGFIRLIPEPAADLLIGYPVAFGLGVVGAVILTR